jgi:pantoate--beta-alanine ligase
MHIVHTISEMRAARADLKSPVGFVPTMGALHAGHDSLVRRARTECASVVASIFVNPLQFAPHEDFNRYPRTFEADGARLENLGTDVVFAPEMPEMYPPREHVTLVHPELSQNLEGERRPQFLSGVATVVLKLFNIVRPDRAYFGQKDAQQLAVVRAMVADFDLPIDIVGCPIVREPDGLALSSRNAYLNPEERRQAIHLYRALGLIAARLKSGVPHINEVVREAEAVLPPLKLDYLAVVNPLEFEPLYQAPPATDLLAVGAAFAGTTRLIDNLEFTTP